MTNKITLAELRKEAKRVGCVETQWGFARDGMSDWSDVPFVCVYVGSTQSLEVSGASRMDARRRMLRLLRALPDGALKEG